MANHSQNLGNFKDLTKVPNDLGEVKDMTEHTIRDCLVETKDWKKDLKSYRDLKEAIDLDVLSTDIDDAATTKLDEAYEEMSNTVTKKMEDEDEKVTTVMVCSTHMKITEDFISHQFIVGGIQVNMTLDTGAQGPDA